MVNLHICGSADEFTDYAWQMTPMAATPQNLGNDDYFKFGKIGKFVKEEQDF